MPIDRCCCFDKTFADLKAAAKQSGAETVEELQRYARFGARCRLCQPYVRRMLRTGQTAFDRIVTAQDEPPIVEVQSSSFHAEGGIA